MSRERENAHHNWEMLVINGSLPELVQQGDELGEALTLLAHQVEPAQLQISI